MNYRILGCLCALALGMAACNEDRTLTLREGPELSFPDGVRYTVKVGEELAIEPTVLHAEEATYAWLRDGVLLCDASVLRMSWTEAEQFYLVFRVVTPAGHAEEELSVEVAERTPPVISLPLPADGLKVAAGASYRFQPLFRHDDVEGFACFWERDGAEVSREREYLFSASETGRYALTLRARNADGETEKRFTVEVVDHLPYVVRFPPPTPLQQATDRSLFRGGSLCLRPTVEGFTDPCYVWSVDGVPVGEATGRLFRFAPDEPGDYRIRVEVQERLAEEQHATGTLQAAAAAEVTVHALALTAAERRRPATAASSPRWNRVYEYLPAPGQFIGDTVTGGFRGWRIDTHDEAVRFAEARMDQGNWISLGGFGGYVVVGFDHSIARGSGTYDFAIGGNAFDTSSEPGIVWVMQDTNGNGCPDDEWYALAGSEQDDPATLQEYAVTYFRPAGERMPVQWIDSRGERGQIDYLFIFHKQPSYYPAWADATAYTLTGVRLAPRNRQRTDGSWSNDPYPWGYADNWGGDCLTEGDGESGDGQMTGFRIDRAIAADGTPAALEYIDFIRVQTGVNARSGATGELSTEVSGFTDISMGS